MEPRAYYASCVPGLASVLAAEVGRKVPGALVSAEAPDRVHFTAACPLGPLFRLRTAEHVFLDMGCLDDLSGSVADLARFEGWLAQAPVREALLSHPDLAGCESPRFRITGVRDGRHEYRSVDAAAAAGAGVVAQTGWTVDLGHPQADFWLQIRDASVVLGLRLSPHEMARRLPVSGVASLKPTVAHAMCLLSDPQPGEIVLDPMCGTASIIAERLLDLPPAAVIGGDIYPKALVAARANLANLPVVLLQADARAIPLPDGSVDKLITNPPWGRRIGSHRADRRLYPRILAEAARVVRPGGRVVMLSLERRLMEACLDQTPELVEVDRLLIDLGGMLPSVWVLDRRS